MNDNGVENLRCGIVKQAAYDYLDAKKRYAENESANALRIIGECKRFFRSEYYQMLCDIDGEELIRILDQKYEEDKKIDKNIFA